MIRTLALAIPVAISQTLLAVPVYLLFELGIFMSRMFAKRREDDPVTASTAGDSQ